MPQTPPEVSLPGGALYPFQVEGVRYISQHRGRALVGDSMGLGKTVQAIAWLYYQPRLRPAVIVVPAAIKPQWGRELQRWLGVEADCITVMKGRKGAEPRNEIVLINYDILKDRLPQLTRMAPKLIVFDESTYIKEPKASRSKAAKQLVNLPSVISVLALTGTPILNRPKELWHQVLCVDPKIFPNFFQYAQNFCNPQRRSFYAPGGGGAKRSAWDFSGASNLDILDRTLREKVMVRRRKEEVLEDLPAYQKVTIPIEAELSAYQAVLQESRERLRALREELRAQRADIQCLPKLEQIQALAERAEANSVIKLYGLVMQEIERLKQEAALAKLPAILDWLTDAIANEEPLVLFVHHHLVADLLLEKLRERFPDRDFPEILDGRMSNHARRQQYVDRFAAGEWPLIICGIQAMSFGIDGLQRRASRLVFCEMAWSPAAHDQAASRLHRHGQKSSVTGYYMLALGTIEEQIASLLDAKATVTSAATGEMDQAGIIESVMDAIIEAA